MCHLYSHTYFAKKIALWPTVWTNVDNCLATLIFANQDIDCYLSCYMVLLSTGVGYEINNTMTNVDNIAHGILDSWELCYHC